MKAFALTFFVLLSCVASVFATSSAPAVVSVFNAGTQNVTVCTGIGYTHGSENSDGSDYAGVSGGVIYSTSGFPIAPGGWGTVTVESEHYGSPYAYYSVELGFNVATVGTVIVDTPWAAYGAPVSIAVEGSLPVFTNITLNAYNSYSVAAVATFTWNGSVVKTLTLPAGGSSSWVSPSVEVSPTADNWTANVSVNQVTPQIGSDGSGSLIFTNPSDGFSSSGTGGSYTNTSSGSGSVSSGTNGITLTSGNGSVQPSTNSVIWSAPAGSASESTLQSGFSLLHNDSQSILGGQSILNNTLKAGFLDITNSLGQLVRLQTAFSNETLQVISAITNLASVGSSNSSVFPTNLATENTLQGISNLLSSGATNYDTNTDAASSGWLSLASTYMLSGSNSLISLGAGVDSTPAWSVDTRFGSDTINWVVNIPYCGNYNIDLNPFHLSWVVELAAWIRFFLKWAFIAALIVACIDDVLKAISSFAAAHASSSASHSIIGTVVSAVTHPIGTVLSIGVSLVMAKILMMVISFATNWFAGYLATFAANPFGSTMSTYVSEAIWMLDQFVPLSVMTACVFCHYLFKLALAAVVWSVDIAIRFIVGL